MRKIILPIIYFILISGICFAADPAEGFWLSIDEKSGKITAGWEIYIVDNKLYGKILSITEFPQYVKAEKNKESYKGFTVPGKANELPVVGTPWLFDLKMDSPGVWSGGSLIDPQTGNMYKGKVIFHKMDGNKYKSDTLEMRGEVIFGIGRSQFWKRSTREEASSLRFLWTSPAGEVIPL